METDDPARTPLWAWALLGWLALAVLRARLELRAVPPPLPAAATPFERSGGLDGASVPDLTSLSVQALRGLPGIGDGRAVAIARARWEAGLLAPDRAGAQPLPLVAIEGIGPRTAERVEAWLVGQGASPDDDPGPVLRPPSEPVPEAGPLHEEP